MVTDERKQEIVKRISECREQIGRVRKLAPDTIPPQLQALAAEPEESTMAKLEGFLKEKETEEEQVLFCNQIETSMSSTIDWLEKFEADLRLRIQPEGVPRVKRKFQGFGKRKGSW